MVPFQVGKVSGGLCGHYVLPLCVDNSCFICCSFEWALVVVASFVVRVFVAGWCVVAAVKRTQEARRAMHA